MREIDFRVTEQMWHQLRGHCQSSFRKGVCAETGAIGLVGQNQCEGRSEYLLAKLVLPQQNDLKVASYGGLVFDASYIRRAYLEMRRTNLAGLVFFHTHPAADSRVHFSPYDDEQEPVLVKNLQELAPQMAVVSLVLGKSSQCGRVWHSGRCASSLARLVIVGETLRYLPLDGAPGPAPPPPEAIFDRAMLLTGAGALGLLSQMRIAVIGASGTGSIVCLLLACAGCRNVLVIDPDIVEGHNLPRIIFATAQDAALATPKVEVVKRGIEALGLGCHVDAVQESVLAQSTIQRLCSADVIFGCVDKAFPRNLLCSFTYQFLRPLIDVGAEIGGDHAGIVSLDTRASYIAPGRPCLQCMGIVTARQVTVESLSNQERQRVKNLGYSDDLFLNQPAVMDLNMGAARLGVMILRHLLQPFLAQPLPLAITENVINYSMRAIRRARVINPSCLMCQAGQHLGFGHCGPPIGLTETAVTAIGKAG